MIGVPGERSRTLTWEQVIAAQPEVLLISCCGFDIERTKTDLPILFQRLGGCKLPCFETGSVFILDGSAFLSRPGPRLVTALELIAWALHPNCVTRPKDTSGIERLP